MTDRPKQNKIKNSELSKAEKFYIESNCIELSLAEIQADLKSDSSTIENYYNDCLDRKKNENTIDKLMIVNSKSGYTVMSKEASEKGEATRKKSTPPLSNHIHRIRPDKR